jgi:NDP-sugar pyrophosphorylase family protein
MVGGRGQRLMPYTDVLPKPLLPVAGRPILETLIRQLAAFGFQRVTMCLGHLGDLIATYFGDGETFGIEIDYVVEPRPLGTIGALQLVSDFDEPALVLNGDLLTDLDFGALLDEHTQSSAAITLATCRQEVDIALGVLDFATNGELTRFREKPKLDYWACMGIYAMSPQVLEAIPANQSFGVDALVEGLLQRGHRNRVFRFEGLWLDVANAEDCLRATETLRKRGLRLVPATGAGLSAEDIALAQSS